MLYNFDDRYGNRLDVTTYQGDEGGMIYFYASDTHGGVEVEMPPSEVFNLISSLQSKLKESK